MRGNALLVLAVGSMSAMAGCASEGPTDVQHLTGIMFSVAAQEWAAADTIDLLLRNDSGHALGYNLCSAQLQRRVGLRWQQVQNKPEGAACMDVLLTLRAGASVVGRQVVHPFIEAGTYRFYARVQWPLGTRHMALVSNTFRVMPD